MKAPVEGDKRQIYFKRDEREGYRPIVLSVREAPNDRVDINKVVLGTRSGVHMGAFLTLTREEWVNVSREINRHFGISDRNV